jgi:LCP family protein required for cell wall assembly
VTRSQKTILTVLSVIAGTLLLAVGYYGVRAYQFYAAQPLGPQLPASTPLFFPSSTPFLQTPVPGPTLAPTISFATNTPPALCGGPNVMTILAIGSDARSDTYNYGLADVIRVVRVDFITPKVTVLEFPRDLWVQIPFIADNLDGQDHEKLNQAYLYGNPGDGFRYWEDPSAGPGLLSLTLNINFGVSADRYIAVNMRTFEKIVDSVDGVDVNVPDKDTANATGLTIGTHHLNGPEALKVARNRQEGTFQRGNNQNLVLCALGDKILSPTVLPRIPDLIASFQDNIQTDFTPAQLGQLACLATKLPLENIAFASFPEELFTATRVYDPVFKKRVFIWDVDFSSLRDYVNLFNTGVWPPLGTTEIEESTSYCP